LRLLPWIRGQAFVPGYWAFSFGVAALPTMAIRMLERGATGPLLWVAPVLFVVATLIIGVLVLKTLEMFVRGTLISPAAMTSVVTQDQPASGVARVG
jgi:tellurite resistance protein